MAIRHDSGGVLRAAPANRPFGSNVEKDASWTSGHQADDAMRPRPLSGSGGNPTLSRLTPKLKADDDGASMCRFVGDLHRVCQSVRGDGSRATLAALRKHIPITVHEVPSGTPIFDWTVPPEWHLRDAYIKHVASGRVIDLSNSNLGVVSYSSPVRDRMSLAELRRRIFSVPGRPDWVPYRKSFDSGSWGFYLGHEEVRALPKGEYEVCIDCSLEPGHLAYGEYLLRGRSFEEVLISCHLRNPSFSNDNLSGIAVATALVQELLSKKLRYSYRFLFIPSTIGSIAWLVLNQSRLFRVKHGLVLTQLGDSGSPAYKMSRRGDAEIDRVFDYVLKEAGPDFKIEPFSPCGHDERQYCSPGLNLPVGRFMRAPLPVDPESRTERNDLTSVHPEALHDSLTKLLSVIDVLELNRCYFNQNPFCEPQLSNYGLAQFAAGSGASEHRRALRWVLNFSDGDHTLLDIAACANLRWEVVKRAAQALCACGLLKAVGRPRSKSPRKRGRQSERGNRMVARPAPVR
jgi:aminopeptidase-like protein